MGESKTERVTELRVLPLDVREFECNGKKWTRHKTLSPSRWADMQRIQVELGFGATFAQLSEKLQEQKLALRKVEFDKAVIINHEMILGIALIDEKRIPTALKMCALFLNYEGEDVRHIDEKLIAEKVNDWNEGGLDVMSLFTLALSAIPDYLSAYKIASPGSFPSPPEAKQEESITNNGSQE